MATSFPSDPTAPRFFIDASVIIAGVGSRVGASHAILALAELGLLRPVVCPYVMDEADRNIQRKTPEALPRFREVRANINWETVPDPAPEQVAAWIGVIVPKDAPVLAAAVAAQPHRLVTLDSKDFIEPKRVAAQSGLRICTPGDLLRDIRGILARGFGEE
jgi:predicted nucleic acid-binding protein